MPIYLEPKEIKYLLKRLEGKKPKEFWLEKIIVGKLSSQQETNEEVAECDHEIRTYDGRKECCSKCGRIWKIEWSLVGR